jgi:MFS family permease
VSDAGERPAEPETAAAVAASPSRRMAVDLSPLRRHRDFRVLWIGSFVSLFGSQLTRVAIPFQVYALTRSSFAVGLLAVAELGPILGLSLWGGAVADAVDRRRVMVRTDAALVVVSLALAVNGVAFARPNLMAIYGLAAVAAALYCFGRPAFDAAIPRLVPTGDFPAAAALNGLQYNLGGIFGPALAGVLIAAFGVGPVFVIDAATFGAALACGLLLAPIPPAPGARPAGLRSIGEGLTYVRRSQLLMGSYAIDLVAMVFGMPNALLPALAVETFHGDATTLGLLAAAPAAGALLASVLSGWTARVRRYGVAIAAGAAAWGVAIVAFGLTDRLALALVALAVAGAADMVSGIFRMVLWNRVVPDELRGRLAGVELAGYASGPALGNFEAGWVASLRSLRFSVVSGGVACVVGAVAVIASLREFRQYRLGD